MIIKTSVDISDKFVKGPYDLVPNTIYKAVDTEDYFIKVKLNESRICESPHYQLLVIRRGQLLFEYVSKPTYLSTTFEKVSAGFKLTLEQEGEA